MGFRRFSDAILDVSEEGISEGLWYVTLGPREFQKIF